MQKFLSETVRGSFPIAPTHSCHSLHTHCHTHIHTYFHSCTSHTHTHTLPRYIFIHKLPVDSQWRLFKSKPLKQPLLLFPSFHPSPSCLHLSTSACSTLHFIPSPPLSPLFFHHSKTPWEHVGSCKLSFLSCTDTWPLHGSVSGYILNYFIFL